MRKRHLLSLLSGFVLGMGVVVAACAGTADILKGIQSEEEADCEAAVERIKQLSDAESVSLGKELLARLRDDNWQTVVYAGKGLGVLGRHAEPLIPGLVAELRKAEKEDLPGLAELAGTTVVQVCSDAGWDPNLSFADIVALIENRADDETPDRWKIISCHASAGTRTIPTATVELQRDGEKVFCDAAIGGGPIEAVLHAMERIIGISATLQDLQIRSVTKGRDALGEVYVEVLIDDRLYRGKGVSVDIIEGSALAYLNALNKAEAYRRAQAEQPTAPTV